MVRIPTTPVGRNFESFLLDPLGLFLHHYLPLLLQGCPSSSQTSTSSSSSSNAKSASGSIGRSRPGSPVGRLPHLSVQTPALSETRTNKVGGGQQDKGKDRDKQRHMKTPALSETKTNKVRGRQLDKQSQTQQGFVRDRLLLC